MTVIKEEKGNKNKAYMRYQPWRYKFCLPTPVMSIS